MAESKTSDAERTLNKSAIHKEWVGNYRTADNEKFYNMAFDYIVKSFGSPVRGTVLDAGCGSCAKSKNLADRGFDVIGTDLSESALSIARDSLTGTKYESKISLQHQNLNDITLPDESFEYVVCWGVLMHIPEVGRAISELCRITKKGGFIAVSEANMFSLQSRLLRLAKKLLRRERADVKIVPAGVENWEETDEGRLMTRQANIDWLVSEFSKHGLQLQSRVPGQFTEMYWVFRSSLVKSIIHALNHIWFKYIRFDGLAFGNILIFKKA